MAKTTTKKKTAKKVTEKTTTKKKTKKVPASARKGGRTPNRWTSVKFREIAKFVKDNGLAQSAFAAAAEVTNSTYHNWKNDRCAPDATTQARIRDILDGKIKIPAKIPGVGATRRKPRGAGSLTLAKLKKDKKTKPSKGDSILAVARTPKARKSSSNGNGNGNGNAWADLNLLGEFLRANKGRTPVDVHVVVDTALELMV